MRFIAVFFLFVFCFSCSAQDENTIPFDKFQKYKSLYNVECVEDKITDNRGEGFKDLYGTRNFRTILHGVAYRGGGNNYYHKTNKRNNKNPLPLDGLNNLLKNGFSTSVYLYNENFETSPPFITSDDMKDTLYYFQLGGNNYRELDSILMFTYNAIMRDETGPVYLHCWNGWHQSGYVAAVLLKQFCGYSTRKSLHYWEDCADNWTRGYDRIRDAIRNFKPIEKYKISQEISNAICPCYEDIRSDDIVMNNNDQLKSLKVSVKFPYNVSDLPPSVSTFLDEYAKMLQNNSFLSVEVSGHTDARGNAAYNQTLSEQRAKNVYDYLIKQGVDDIQLSHKGYGETRLVNKCSDGVSCSESMHEKNRRIDFEITSISHQINFTKGSVNISKADKKVLNDIFLILSSDPSVKIEIGGHADKSKGTDFVNQNLSERRAERVFNYLKDNGLDMNNITFKGYGSTKEKYYDERDRRIEFVILDRD